MIVAGTDTIEIQGSMVLVPKNEYDQMRKAWQNEKYRKKLEHSMEQSRQGRVVVKSMEELERMEHE